ncbi:MAG: hypothetical protein JWR80_6172 [Bradyrhizobium sp.]|nr:hypothetical protein [Bradyrhizobium sp.]
MLTHDKLIKKSDIYVSMDAGNGAVSCHPIPQVMTYAHSCGVNNMGSLGNQRRDPSDRSSAQGADIKRLFGGDTGHLLVSIAVLAR